MARTVYRALKPSNVRLPEGMTTKISRRANILEFRIILRGRLETLFSTTEEVLDDLAAVVETLEAARA